MFSTIIKLVIRGFKDLRVNPWAQALTFCAVTAIAFLAGLFLLLIHNLDKELLKTRGDVVFQIYWRQDADQTKISSQVEQISQLPYFSGKSVFTPSQALDALEKSMGSDLSLDWIRSSNPLPFTALFSFEPRETDPDAWNRNMLSYFKSLPGVDKVHYNNIHSDLANNWAKISNRVIWPLIAFLALLLALIVGNTIKLALLSRKDEIEILHLVGASDWFIQLPLLIGSIMHALGGSLLAIGMLLTLQYTAKDIFNFPPFYLQFTFLPFEQVVILIGLLVCVCIVSSQVAARDDQI